jgi:hypothetical protein
LSKHVYKKRSKFHITDKEAQIIGDAFEQCGSEIGSRGVSVEQFEAFCAKPSHPVHDIWKRRCDKIRAGAGRAAAAYLMSAVQIIVIHQDKTPVGRAFTTITIEEGDGTYSGTGYRSEDVARNVDLLDLAERDMDRQVRGLAESFAAVAGGDRMYSRLLLIASEVRDLFTENPSPRPRNRASDLEKQLDAHAE